MRSAVLGLLVALAAGGVSAQTTTCHESPLGLTTTCHTTPGLDTRPPLVVESGPSEPVDWRNVPPKPCNAFDWITFEGEVCNARAVAAARKKVGEQIAAGDCDGALKGALATGDLTFAREVRDFCASPPAR